MVQTVRAVKGTRVFWPEDGDDAPTGSPEDLVNGMEVMVVGQWVKDGTVRAHSIYIMGEPKEEGDSL